MCIPCLKIKMTSNMDDDISFPLVFLSQHNTDTPSSAIIYIVNGALLLDARRTGDVDREFLRSLINLIYNRLLNFICHAYISHGLMPNPTSICSHGLADAIPCPNKNLYHMMIWSRSSIGSRHKGTKLPLMTQN
jgi:hypothetical protein